MNINCEEALKLIEISNSDSFIKNVNFLLENLTNNPFLSTGFKTDILSDTTNHIRIDAYRHLYPIAGINPKPKKNNILEDNKQSDYIPCNHPGTCHIDICSCLQNRGYCEKNCNCFYYCEFLYKSCACVGKCDSNCRCENESAALSGAPMLFLYCSITSGCFPSMHSSTNSSALLPSGNVM